MNSKAYFTAKYWSVFVLIMILSFSGSRFAYAESELDSLETLLPYANDQQKVDLLNGISFQLKTINAAKAQDYALQAYNLSHKLGYIKGEAYAHILLGIFKKNKSDYKTARYEYLIGLKQSLQARDTATISFALFSMGNLYNLRSDYPHALKYYLMALHLAEKINDQKRISKTLNNIGAIYLDLKDYTKAEQFYLRAYDLEKTLKVDELSLAELSNNLANIYQLQGYHYKSLFYYNNCLDVFRKLGSITDISTVLNNISAVYIARNEAQKAFRFVYEALPLTIQSNDELGQIYSYSNLSKAHLKNHRLDSAEYYGLKSMEIAKKSHFKNEYLTTLEDLSILYEKLNNKDKAYFYLLESRNLEEKIKGSEKTSKMGDLQSNYANLKKTEEIKDLKKENYQNKEEINEKQETIERKNFFILMLILGLVVVILLAALIMYLINLTKQKKEIELGSMRKSNIIDKVNFEIRDPLNAVVGYATLAGESKNMKDLRENLTGIQNSGAELMFVMNNIIHFMEIESGKAKSYPIRFNLLSQLTVLLKNYQKQCAAKGVLFYQMVYPEVPEIIQSDRSKIQCILDNLLNNALKFSNSGIIKFEMSAGQLISRDNQRWVPLKIRISDEGKGMEARILKSVYKPFAQAKNNREGGAGIGLHIVSHFVKLLGGKIQIQSEPNQGTEVTIQLEVNVPSQTENTIVFPEQFTPAPLDILIAQPHQSTEKILTRFLESKGHSCVRVVNGLEALETLHRQLFDLMLIETDLPEMNGMQLVHKIREDMDVEVKSSMKIVAISALSTEEDIQNCLKAGFDRYLVKPVLREDLYNLLDEISRHPNS